MVEELVQRYINYLEGKGNESFFDIIVECSDNKCLDEVITEMVKRGYLD